MIIGSFVMTIGLVFAIVAVPALWPSDELEEERARIRVAMAQHQARQSKIEALRKAKEEQERTRFEAFLLKEQGETSRSAPGSV